METVDITKQINLCISCGICAGVCPLHCITMVKDTDSYLPEIGEECVKCGKCFEVCPGKGKKRETFEELVVEDLIGTVQASYNAWSKNDTIRCKCASGGVVTTMIFHLLKRHIYDAAFVVKDFNYCQYVKSKIVTNGDEVVDFSNDTYYSSKSRYIPIGHSDTVSYITKNPMARLIIVGTSCALRGLANVITQQKLDRKNYLFIGLFCESVFNYRVWDYFGQRCFSKGHYMTALHFKNKESGGWPGNIKAIYEDGTHRYINSSYRTEIKQFLKPERCLYCVDKLNTIADISLGDNYTGVDTSELGSNTVLIRTTIGKKVWNECKHTIIFKEVNTDYIIEAQLLEERMNNMAYALIKEKNIMEQYSIQLDINAMDKTFNGHLDENEYRALLDHLRLGNNLKKLYRYLRISHGKNYIKRRIKLLYNRKKRKYSNMGTLV